MFFRMIKKDLKDSRGLNAIILFFMVIVSALVAASALLIFANFRGVSVSQERCKPYDAAFGYTKSVGATEEQQKRMEEIIREKYPDAEIEHLEGIDFQYTNISYEGIDYEALNKIAGNQIFILMKQPRVMNLVYDQDNYPFHVENGHMAVTYMFAKQTGIKVGDKIDITASSGKQFEFTVSHIMRDPINDHLVRFIISDADYEVLSKECPEKMGITGFDTKKDFTENDRKVLNSIISKDPDVGDLFHNSMPDGHKYSNSALVSTLVSFFLLITCIFMILIIMFTIGFTIRSVIKKEERELGIMKALGTDSVSFRWLVAAKYIAFAIIGGLVGAVLGVFIGNKLIGSFYYNISYSIGAIDYIVAAAATLVIIGLVIIFILISMRRINKISVMDVLHGESRQDRIKHSGRFALNKKKKMSIPLFLALSDIFGNFKRYILLFIAFTIGSSVVLLNIQIRDSVISPDFMYKFYTWKKLDAVPNLDDKTFNEISSGTGRADMMVRGFEELMKKEGIRATLETKEQQNARMEFGEESETVALCFGFNPEGLVIRTGGQYPKLRNEVLMDYYTASIHDVNIGDKVTIVYDKYTPDRLSTEEVSEDFVVTGFVDRLSSFNDRDVIMSKEFKDARPESWNAVSFTLDVPDNEKQAEYEKLDKLFPGQMMTDKDMIVAMLSMYDVLFTFMRNLMIVVVAGVLGFLVVMYQTIFMKDEEPEIALLMSTGVDERSTKNWQFLRMMLIFGAGVALSLILTPTIVARLLGVLFSLMLGLTGFGFTRGLLMSVIWTVFITAFIAIVMRIVIRKIRNIEIWRIRNE